MLVNTIHGEMDDSLLEKREGVDEHANDSAEWVEYWFKGELVHRSVHVTIKRGPEMFSAQGSFQ